VQRDGGIPHRKFLLRRGLKIRGGSAPDCGGGRDCTILGRKINNTCHQQGKENAKSGGSIPYPWKGKDKRVKGDKRSKWPSFQVETGGCSKDMAYDAVSEDFDKRKSTTRYRSEDISELGDRATPPKRNK